MILENDICFQRPGYSFFNGFIIFLPTCQWIVNYKDLHTEFFNSFKSLNWARISGLLFSNLFYKVVEFYLKVVAYKSSVAAHATDIIYGCRYGSTNSSKPNIESNSATV